jgi:hypothetical protein
MELHSSPNYEVKRIKCPYREESNQLKTIGTDEIMVRKSSELVVQARTKLQLNSQEVNWAASIPFYPEKKS